MFLPACLRHLSLTDDLYGNVEDKWRDAEILPLIQEFVEEKKYDSSEFERISLRLNYVQIDWCEEARIRLKAICERAGIKCTIFK